VYLVVFYTKSLISDQFIITFGLEVVQLVKPNGGKKMAKMRILSSLGDTIVEWNTEKATDGDVEAQKAVKEAERIFKEARARGVTAFRVDAPDKPAERIDKFDKAAEQIIVVPRVAGG